MDVVVGSLLLIRIRLLRSLREACESRVKLTKQCSRGLGYMIGPPFSKIAYEAY
jgi:hypothetical protein